MQLLDRALVHLCLPPLPLPCSFLALVSIPVSVSLVFFKFFGSVFWHHFGGMLRFARAPLIWKRAPPAMSRNHECNGIRCSGVDGIETCSVVVLFQESTLQSRFLEGLLQALCFYASKEAWFEVLVVRASLMEEIAGGVSALMGAILDSFFDVDRHHMQLGGVCLRLADESMAHIFLSLGMLIADEAALHAALACKGSSGLKPCMLCGNVFNRRSVRQILENDKSGMAVLHDCDDMNKCMRHTMESLAAIVATLRQSAGEMSNKDFQELQTRLGWNYEPAGLMFSERWRTLVSPPSVCTFDWMHIFFVNGIFNAHAGLLLREMRTRKVTPDMLHQYCSEWRWPAAVGSASGADVFGPKRVRSSLESSSLKAGASEGLSLWPVMANFCRALASNHPDEVLKQHCSCFLRLAAVLELLQASMRRRISAEGLMDAIRSYLRAFVAVYGAEHVVPKFHYALHLPEILERCHFLPSCFVHERKHRMPKRYGNQVQNVTGDWHAGVLRDCTAHHLAAAAEDSRDRFGAAALLLEPKLAKGNLQSLLESSFGAPGMPWETSRSARVNAWERCSVGDLVLCTGAPVGLELGFVSFFAAAQEDAEPIAGLRLLRREGGTDRAWKCRRTAEQRLTMADQICAALIWAGTGPVITALIPHRI